MFPNAEEVALCMNCLGDRAAHSPLVTYMLWGASYVGLSVVVGTATMGMLVRGLDAGSADCQTLP